MAAKRGAESARDPLEIVRIARHDEVRTSERSGDHNRVDDVASTGARADWKRFLRDEWPLIRERINALDPEALLK
jgi:hypothetical protein